MRGMTVLAVSGWQFWFGLLLRWSISKSLVPPPDKAWLLVGSAGEIGEKYLFDSETGGIFMIGSVMSFSRLLSNSSWIDPCKVGLSRLKNWLKRDPDPPFVPTPFFNKSNYGNINMIY